jgi:glycosyltransferase involved in cell wall biosynthesis
MKVGIYSPYLDTVGGGERYMLTIAEALSEKNDVDIILDTHLQALDLESITKKVSQLLGLDLKRINFIKAPFGKNTNFLDRLNFTKKYDLFFYLTDGSIFYSSAKSSILHIQSPLTVSNISLWNKIKQSSWKLIIYNSQFTKEHCQKFWGINGEVLYPPVSTEIFKTGKKKNQILTVGRFFGHLRDKKHSLMISSFKKIYDSGTIKDWSFHLAGGAGEGDLNYVKELEELSKGYPIFIHPNLEFSLLTTLYSESSIYWHAAGFGETDPSKMEHFGITTVEAMASGCVPVVINLGGQKEIVDNSENGLLWNTPDEMENLTLKLIHDEKLLRNLSKAAQLKSSQFSKQKFTQSINNIAQKYAPT